MRCSLPGHCGKRACRSIFIFTSVATTGWASARKGFSSFRAGLEYIAHQLANGRYYKNKTLGEKVRMYNPSPQYARQLEKLMRKIDAALPSLASYPVVSLAGAGFARKENE